MPDTVISTDTNAKPGSRDSLAVKENLSNNIIPQKNKLAEIRIWFFVSPLPVSWIVISGTSTSFCSAALTIVAPQCGQVGILSETFWEHSTHLINSITPPRTSAKALSLASIICAAVSSRRIRASVKQQACMAGAWQDQQVLISCLISWEITNDASSSDSKIWRKNEPFIAESHDKVNSWNGWETLGVTVKMLWENG